MNPVIIAAMANGLPLRSGYVSACLRVLLVCLVFPGLPAGFMIPRCLGQVQRVQDVAWSTALGWAAVVAAAMTIWWWLAGGRMRFASFGDPLVDVPLSRVRLAGELALPDLLRALWTQVRPRPIFAVLGLIIVGSAIALPVLSMRRHGVSWRDALVLLGVLTFIGHLVTYAPLRLYWAFRRNPLLRGQVSFTLDGDGLRAEGAYGQSQMPWSVFDRWRDGGGVALVHVRGGSAILIPLRMAASDDERELVRRLLRHKLGAAA